MPLCRFNDLMERALCLPQKLRLSALAQRFRQKILGDVFQRPALEIGARCADGYRCDPPGKSRILWCVS